MRGGKEGFRFPPHAERIHTHTMPTLSKGYFIAFEGIDNSGKSTQAEILAVYLNAHGYPAILTHELGGTLLGEKVRDIILAKHILMDPHAEIALIMAQRSQHNTEVILPALANKQIVVCDRYVHSTYAYQHYGKGIDKVLIEELEELITSTLRPDLVLHMAISAAESIAREKKTLQRANNSVKTESGSDRYMQLAIEDAEFLRRVEYGYVRMSFDDNVAHQSHWEKFTGDHSRTAIAAEIAQRVTWWLELQEKEQSQEGV